MVLKKWYELSSYRFAWKNVEIAKEQRTEVNAHVLHLLGDLEGLADLTFSCFENKLTQQDFECILRCQALKRLQVTVDSLPENQNEISELKKLESVSIHGSEIDMEMANAIYALPKLEILEIVGKIIREARQKLLNKPGLKYVFIQNQQSNKAKF